MFKKEEELDNKPLLSVIVPFKNSENYISRCLDSLISQTYKKIELIFVNNRSTDGTKDIIMAKTSHVSRVKIVEADEKDGVSYARNIGLRYVNGDYIFFVDSDDSIESNFFEMYLEIGLKNDCDIVIGDIIYIRDYDSENYNAEPPMEYSFIFDNKYDSFSRYAHRSVCAAMFKTSIIKAANKQCFFSEEITIGEDVLFYTEALINSKRNQYNSTLPKYLYFIHGDSSYNSRSLFDEYSNIIAHKRIVGLMKQTRYKKAVQSATKYYSYKVYDLMKKLKMYKNQTKMKRKIKHDVFKLAPFVLFSNKFKISYKIRWLLFLIG